MSMVDVDGIAAYIVRRSARVGRLSLRAGGTWRRDVYSSNEPGERIELSQWLCDDDCTVHVNIGITVAACVRILVVYRLSVTLSNEINEVWQQISRTGC